MTFTEIFQKKKGALWAQRIEKELKGRKEGRFVFFFCFFSFPFLHLFFVSFIFHLFCLRAALLTPRREGAALGRGCPWKLQQSMLRKVRKKEEEEEEEDSPLAIHLVAASPCDSFQEPLRHPELPSCSPYE